MVPIDKSLIKVFSLTPKGAWPALNEIQKLTFPKTSKIAWTEGYWWGAFVVVEPNKKDKLIVNVPGKSEQKTFGGPHARLIGFATMQPSSQFSDAAYMSRCGVLKEYRGLGLQHQFIKERIKKARLEGFNYVVTDTTENPKSANNLIKEGFVTYLPDRPYGYQCTYYWIKDIRPKDKKNKVIE